MIHGNICPVGLCMDTTLFQTSNVVLVEHFDGHVHLLFILLKC